MLASLLNFAVRDSLFLKLVRKFLGCGLQKIVVPLITRVTLVADNANDFP